jgi:hypothetical protein
MTHPEVGELDLVSNKLTIGGTDGLTLVVFHATPGSRSAELLALLGSLSAPTTDRTTQPTTGSQPTTDG